MWHLTEFVGGPLYGENGAAGAGGVPADGQPRGAQQNRHDHRLLLCRGDRRPPHQPNQSYTRACVYVCAIPLVNMPLINLGIGAHIPSDESITSAQHVRRDM